MSSEVTGPPGSQPSLLVTGLNRGPTEEPLLGGTGPGSCRLQRHHHRVTVGAAACLPSCSEVGSHHPETGPHACLWRKSTCGYRSLLTVNSEPPAPFAHSLFKQVQGKNQTHTD